MKSILLPRYAVLFALSAMTAPIVGAPALAEEFVASQSKTVVETNKGNLVGALDDGIYSYLGVPYARRPPLPSFGG